jgi:hypothetical protein
VATIVKPRKPSRVAGAAATQVVEDEWTPDLLGVLGSAADLLDPPPHPYAANPVGWVHDRLGEETWSGQDAILKSVWENRKTGVWSCHSAGKSHIASRVIGAWLDVHPIDDVFVVTTAPSASQVRGILWRYVKDAHRKAGLPGYITESEIPEWKIDGRLVGWGRKPQSLASEEQAKSVFQGIHAKYVLVVLDEADGVPKWLYDAITTLVTSPTNRVLAIGNPDNPASHFAKIRNDPESDWNKITITAFDTPAYTGEPISQDLADHLISQEWVEEVKKEWGEDNPLYVSKVLAQYPESSDDALITTAMIQKMIAAYGELPGDEQGKYAMDVSRKGKDKTVVYRNRGGVITKIAEWSGKTTDITTNRARAILEPHQKGVPMIIDIGGGLGAAPFDNLRAEGYPVHAFDGAAKPLQDERPDRLRFINRRAEQYWALRELADSGEVGIDPANLSAQAQLAAIKWDKNATGKIFVEKKEDISKRLGRSPDDADAIMMSTTPVDEWHLVAQDAAVHGHEPRSKDRSHTSDLLDKTW